MYQKAAFDRKDDGGKKGVYLVKDYEITILKIIQIVPPSIYLSLRWRFSEIRAVMREAVFRKASPESQWTRMDRCRISSRVPYPFFFLTKVGCTGLLLSKLCLLRFRSQDCDSIKLTSSRWWYYIIVEYFSHKGFIWGHEDSVNYHLPRPSLKNHSSKILSPPCELTVCSE